MNERRKIAEEAFKEGYNCSQSVAIAFADLVNISKEELLRLCAPFGGGMGRLREVCGAFSGSLVILGLIDGYATPETGDKKAELVYNAMVYGMGKWTAMMAGALKGKVDAILLTGGMANDKGLCDDIKEYIDWIAPVYNYAGSFETEALGFGAIRVLNGTEEAKTYTGKPVWSGFEWDK